MEDVVFFNEGLFQMILHITIWKNYLGTHFKIKKYLRLEKETKIVISVKNSKSP